MPSFKHSKDAVVKISNSSASLVDVSQYVNSIDYKRPIATHDVTALGNQSLNFISGLKDGDDFTINFLFDPTLETQLNGIFGISPIPTYEFAPNTTVTGSRKLTGSMILTNIGYQVKVGSEILLPCTFKKSGDVTSTVY
jgi:hypothetical protein